MKLGASPCPWTGGSDDPVKVPPALASELFDLLAARRVEALGRGWPDIPEPVFCSQAGTPLDERNVSRVWEPPPAASAEAGDSATEVALCSAHLGNSGSVRGKVNPMGGRSTWAFRSRVDASRLRARNEK
jgi:hypothetical protein